MTIEQLQALAQDTEEKITQFDRIIRMLESVTEDATTEQMVRVLLAVQLDMVKASRSELMARLESLRPALANIIIATPAPGGRQ